MAPGGFLSIGTLLIWNNKPIIEMTLLQPGLGTVEDVDFTSHDSGPVEAFKPGMFICDECSVEGIFLPGDAVGQMSALADFQAKTERSAFVVMPEGKGSLELNAYASRFRPSLPHRAKATVGIEFKTSGKVTLRDTPATGLTTPFFALRDNGGNAVTPSPAAAGGTYWYTATLDTTDTAIAVQPTATAGTIYVNGTLVASGNWSGDIAVAVGTWKLIVIEAREATKASKIYRIWVRRPNP